MKQPYRNHIMLMIKKTNGEKTLRRVYVYVNNSLKESGVAGK